MRMNYPLLVVISGLFSTLLLLILVNRTLAVVRQLSSPVTVRDTIHLQGDHSKFLVGLQLQKSGFQSGSIHTSVKTKNCKGWYKSANQPPVPCPLFNIEFWFEKHDRRHPGLTYSLVAEGNTDWKSRQKLVFECELGHVAVAENEILMMYLVLMPVDFLELLANPIFARAIFNTSMHCEPCEEFFSQFWSRPVTLLSLNHFNHVKLSQTDYYDHGQFQTSYLHWTESRTDSGRRGYTEVEISWESGTVTKFDRVTQGSYWSVATLVCMICLAAERAIGFFCREKAKIDRRVRAESESNTQSVMDTSVNQ